AGGRGGEVRESEPLRNDAVEPRRAQRLKPVAPLLDVLRDRRKLEPGADLLELAAPLLDRALVHRLPLPEQEVEGDERGGDLACEPTHAALRRMEAHLHRVKVERSATGDHDL